MLGRASDLEALGFLSGEVSLASKPEELLIAIAHRCRKLIIIIIIIYKCSTRFCCTSSIIFNFCVVDKAVCRLNRELEKGANKGVNSLFLARGKHLIQTKGSS